MRILVIGYALPDPEIDNYNPFTAPNYSDYDALVIDPLSITREARNLVEGTQEYIAFDERPVINGPTSATAVSGADQLKRRAAETRRLLEYGGTVIVFARPNEVEGGLFGFEGCDRYAWLPAPAGLSWGTPYLRAAEGKTVRIVAEDHPVAGLLREHRKDVSYRATFDDRQAELRAAGRVLAAGGSDVPIAMEFPMFGGRIVFLPAFGETFGNSRSTIASAIVDVLHRLDGSTAKTESPYWVRSIAVPGLEQAEAELETADAAAAEAAAHAATAKAQHDAIERHRRLLWEDGKPFEQAVVDGLRLLGFGLTGGGGGPLSLTSEGKEALLEVESSREQVVEWPYIRLQRRLEERLLKSSEQLKGVVVANGYRDKGLDTREEQFTSALRVACENYQYTLLSSETLFALVQRALGGADEAALTGMRRRIMGAAGVVSQDVALGQSEQTKNSDAGPIF
ncbi:MAG: hypothetical protein ABI305_00600 [Tepidiformaceae bacterium]